MKNDYFFPFSAIVGQEKAKKALMLNIINPNIGGVLLNGEKGTAKSTLVRALTNLIEDMAVVNLPLNITEDRLVGGIDIKKAVMEGKQIVEPGLLERAHKNLLYIDEVNLLSEHIVNILLEVSSTGENVVEREGVSFRHPCRFIFVGSMNSEEGLLRSQFVDRFGLYVQVTGEAELDLRMEIIKNRLKYENNPKEFCEQWKKEDEKISNLIKNAKTILREVKATKENFRFAVELSSEGNCSGNRAELVLIETAKAIAALMGRTTISNEDIKEAAMLALPHRIRKSISIEEEITEEITEEEASCNNGTEEHIKDYQESFEDIQGFSEEDILSDESMSSNSEKTDKDNLEEIKPFGESLSIKDTFNCRRELKGTGKRTKVKTDGFSGRYVKHKYPKGKVRDIALGATIRIAACNQKYRAGHKRLIHIKTEDLREKVREKRTGVTILFLVDASSSMGAKRRMALVKGAVLSLLQDAYQKRDKVGVIAFRKNQAEILLNTTRSIDLAQKCLKSLPTGGKTPLALGLCRAYELLKAEKAKETNCLQYLILVSDGKANVPLTHKDAFEDALMVGKKIYNEGIKSMIMDTENGYIHYGFAEKLSKVMGSSYMKINNYSDEEVKTKIKKLISI